MAKGGVCVGGGGGMDGEVGLRYLLAWVVFRGEIFARHATQNHRLREVGGASTSQKKIPAVECVGGGGGVFGFGF